MADEFKRMTLETPGEAEILVSVVNPEWKYHESKNSKPILLPLLDESGVNFVAECIKERINNKFDCPVLVTGRRGSGKSTVIRKIAKAVDPGFSLTNVAFWLEDFERIFKANPQGNGNSETYPQAWMDEAGHAVFGQRWFDREQQVIVKELIISRIKREVMYFAVPKRKQLNNQLREMPFIWIHIKKSKEYGPSYAILRTAPAELECEWYDTELWVPLCAFIFTPENDDWWVEYEKLKIAFVDEALNSKKAKERSELLLYKQKIAQNLKAKGYSLHECGTIMECDKSTVMRLIKNEATS